MFAGELMTRAIFSVKPEAKLGEAAALMLAQRVSGVPVVDAAGVLVGVLTEDDILRRPELGTAAPKPGLLEAFLHPAQQVGDYIHAHGGIVSELMTRDPVCVAPTTPVAKVAAMMQEKGLRMLPVLQGSILVGVISRSDLLGPLARLQQTGETIVATDASIHSSIMRELSSEHWAPQSGIIVKVAFGVVDFSGTVFSEDERTALKILAENIPGVTKVQDHFTMWYAED